MQLLTDSPGTDERPSKSETTAAASATSKQQEQRQVPLSRRSTNGTCAISCSSAPSIRSSDDSSISSCSPDFMFDMLNGTATVHHNAGMMSQQQQQHHHHPMNSLHQGPNDYSMIEPLFGDDNLHIAMDFDPLLMEDAAKKPAAFPLWPNYLCLFLEYALPYDTASTVTHNLALLEHCYPNCLPVLEKLPSQCPAIDLSHCSNSLVLLAKAKLDINLNIPDFMFNTNCFFESRERRTIECTTTVYSFGSVVLESKEIQQALWINNDKFIYSFVYVNQFFDAFMKGIRSLHSWEQVDIAIQNLCIVQVIITCLYQCISISDMVIYVGLWRCWNQIWLSLLWSIMGPNHCFNACS